MRGIEDRLSAADRQALRADIVAELDELTALVADVVELARGAKPEQVHDDVRLDLIVSAQIDRAQRRAGADASFQAQVEPTVVTGEPERISRAVSNLLDNARKWSPAGGAVEVTLRNGTVAVRDHGPGFDAEDLWMVVTKIVCRRSADMRQVALKNPRGYLMTTAKNWFRALLRKAARQGGKPPT